MTKIHTMEVIVMRGSLRTRIAVVKRRIAKAWSKLAGHLYAVLDFNLKDWLYDQAYDRERHDRYS